VIDPGQLLQHIIRPVLQSLNLYSIAAERLVLGTACQESECGRWVRQIGGPALGIYQMEPATYDDLWTNFLAYQPTLGPKVKKYAAGLVLSNADELVGNLYLATAMCRVHYYRVKEPLPDDLPGQAAYWKQYYNTPSGAGTEAQYRSSWNRFVGVEWT